MAGSFRLRCGGRRSPGGRGGADSSSTRKSPIGVLPRDPRFCFRADTRHGCALVLPKSPNRCPILTATATSTEIQSTAGEGGFCTRDREPKRDAETALGRACCSCDALDRAIASTLGDADGLDWVVPVRSSPLTPTTRRTRVGSRVCEPHNNRCLHRSAPRAQAPRPYAANRPAAPRARALPLRYTPTLFRAHETHVLRDHRLEN